MWLTVRLTEGIGGNGQWLETATYAYSVHRKLYNIRQTLKAVLATTSGDKASSQVRARATWPEMPPQLWVRRESEVSRSGVDA